MNRTIKFRAWDAHESKMWNENNVAPCAGKAMLYEGSTYHEEPHHEFVDRPQFILMQFTGLTDKHGMEIYEGDIVNDFGGGVWKQCRAKKCEHEEKGLHYTAPEDRTRLGVIQFSEGVFGVKTDAMDYVYTPRPLGSSKNWQVIGNIYENPELLAA